jgi:NAD(P)-dependent dehydrogenase (short-subunit alcohol dehydrogenase family)
MPASLERKVVVLTGVGRRGQVGEAVAMAFASAGASLELVDRDRTEVDARADELRRQGAAVTAHVCDLTDAAATLAVGRQIAAAHDGRVHALVNLAGGFGLSGPVADADPAVLPRQIAINLTTAFNASRALLPALRGGGAVVYFASIATLPGNTVAGISAYAAAKSGVVALMRAVAEEERHTGVRANALAPSAIRTAENVKAMGESAALLERENVAQVVLFLCSDAARHITGQVLQLG